MDTHPVNYDDERPGVEMGVEGRTGSIVSVSLPFIVNKGR